MPRPVLVELSRGSYYLWAISYRDHIITHYRNPGFPIPTSTWNWIRLFFVAQHGHCKLCKLSQVLRKTLNRLQSHYNHNQTFTFLEAEPFKQSSPNSILCWPEENLNDAVKQLKLSRKKHPENGIKHYSVIQPNGWTKSSTISGWLKSLWDICSLRCVDRLTSTESALQKCHGIHDKLRK